MTYANIRYIDEARYQTIGRGHGFSELDGIPFKISEKYQCSQATYQGTSHNIYQLTDSRAVEMASSYTFQLEMKVLTNMANDQSRC